jgi:chorismate mutase
VTDLVVERLRAEIAARDRAILDAANTRLELVTALRVHKERTGLDFVDAEQEERLLRALEDANRGPLSRKAVRELFEEILALMKREVARRG